jgi:signal transduction histidine kinase
VNWTMSVIDNGRGMTLSPELYAQQGYGLNNMRERAGAIGGEFHIQSKPGEGTSVIVSLPRPNDVVKHNSPNANRS